MNPVKLILATVAIVVLVFIVNVALMFVGIDPFWTAIGSGIFLLFWFIFFTIGIIWHYLYPRAVYKDVFANWNFKITLAPTQETYEGMYNNVPVKVQFMKGRWHTTVYIFFATNNPFNLAIGPKQPLQTNNVARPQNLPDEFRDLIVLSDDALPAEYLSNANIKKIVLELLQKFSTEIYWEKDAIKIRLSPLVNPDDVRHVIEKAAGLAKLK